MKFHRVDLFNKNDWEFVYLLFDANMNPHPQQSKEAKPRRHTLTTCLSKQVIGGTQMTSTTSVLTLNSGKHEQIGFGPRNLQSVANSQCLLSGKKDEHKEKRHTTRGQAEPITEQPCD